MRKIFIFLLILFVFTGCSSFGILEDQIEKNPFIMKTLGETGIGTTPFCSMVMTKDGNKIIAAKSWDNVIKIWDFENKTKKEIPISKCCKLKLSEKNNLFVAYDENSAKMYSLDDYSPIKKIKYERDDGFKLTEPAFDVEFTPDGKYFFVGKGPNLRMYETRSWEMIEQKDVGEEGQIAMLKMSNDNKTLAVYGFIDKKWKLNIYKVNSKNIQYANSIAINSSDGYVSKMIYTRDSKALIVIGGGYSVDSVLYKGRVKMSTYFKSFGTVRSIDLNNYKIKFLITENDTRYYSGDISEDNKYLTIGKEKGITVHKMEDCEEYKKIKIDLMAVSSSPGARGNGNIIFSSNGKKIANHLYGGHDNRITIFYNPWNFEEFEE